VLPWVSMAQALGWSLGSHDFQSRQSHFGQGYRRIPDSQPSPTLMATGLAGRDRWVVNTRGDRGDHPQGGNEFSADRPSWALTEKARSWHAYRAGSQPNQAVRGEFRRITVEEAACLQTFPVGYPWQGARTKQYQQIGNAVPPLLALHVLAAALGVAVPLDEREAA
jgi:DNA (cytosine-5)-methyltransferase 1